jgi:hypothetical protein
MFLKIFFIPKAAPASARKIVPPSKGTGHGGNGPPHGGPIGGPPPIGVVGGPIPAAITNAGKAIITQRKNNMVMFLISGANIITLINNHRLLPFFYLQFFHRQLHSQSKLR